MAGQEVSFEDMNGAPPSATSQPPVSLPSSAVTADQMFGGEVSAEEMFGGAPVEGEPPSSILDAVGAGAKKYWDDYVKTSNAYADSLKEDSKADSKGLAEDVIQSGKTLLDLLGAAFSPVESAARTGIIEPIQSGISKLSALASQHLASPDVYNAQQRRERWLMGEPVKQQYPGGVDWHIHQADVARTSEDINKFVEVGVLTRVGFIGPKAPVVIEVAGEVGTPRLPLKNLVKLQAETAAGALQDLKGLTSKAIQKFPNLEASIQKLTGNLKDLAIRDPQAVNDLATHVGTVDGALAKKIREIAASAPKDEIGQEALGAQLVKSELAQSDYDAVQVGKISTEGTHFIDGGAPSEGAKFYKYSPDIKIADVNNPETAKSLISQALNRETDPLIIQRLKALRQDLEDSTASLDQRDVEEFGLARYAKTARYDGMKFSKADDPTAPSMTNIWNLNKVAEVTGKTASGKLKLKILGDGLSNTTKDIYTPPVGTTHPDVIKATNKAYTERLLRGEEDRPSGLSDSKRVQDINDNYTRSLQKNPEMANSNLPPPAKEWFGDSKVIDQKGAPRVVYHGTRSSFKKFSSKSVGKSTGPGDWGDGFYFTDSPEIAGSFAKGSGANIRPVYLKIENPAPREVLLSKEIQDTLADDMGFGPSVKEVLAKKGYDGIIWQHGKSTEYVVFDKKQIRSSITADSVNPKGWESTSGEPWTGPSPAKIQYTRDANELSAKMDHRYREAVITDRPIGAHTLLDTMARETKGEYLSAFIAKLRAHIDDVPVRFKEQLYDRGGELKPSTLGHYDPLYHSVEVRVDSNTFDITTTVLHELVHAGTYVWMKSNRDHPLMKELTALMEEAKAKVHRSDRDNLYGFTDEEEFLAEAFTNQGFQYVLSRIKTPAGNLFSKLVGIIRKVFKMDKGQGEFLAKVIAKGEEIFKAQSEASRAPLNIERADVRMRQVGTTPDGKPRMRVTEEDDEVIFTNHGVPVTRAVVRGAFELSEKAFAKIPGMSVVMGKLKEYYGQIIQTFNPEAAGPEAKAAAAVLAKRIAIAMQRDSAFVHRAAVRRGFWNSRQGLQKEFIKRFEKGEKFEDPLMESAALAYRVWNEKILNQDLKNGLEYEPIDNYLYHTFKDSTGVEAFLTQRFGSKWNNPKFIKERGFEMYDQAVAAGFEPRFTNPEDIMLARQHASDIAQMRGDVLSDLERFGLAEKVKEGKSPPEGYLSTEWRAPNGTRYWVHNTSSQVMHNAFNTKSLWTMPGIGGDLFRGAMWLKNAIVPIKLALSLFHPLHVATIDNATGMVRASKELLSGTMSPGKWMSQMAKSALYLDVLSAPKAGYRLLKAYQGKLKDSEFTDTDVHALRLMAEGGFIPEMSSQYRTQAWDKFKDAVQRRSVAAAWHLPFATIDLMQKPMFQVWIPSLKIASYLKDAQVAFRTDPSLLDNPLKRQIALRQLAKSVDNRYGEMAYNTLFWNRWVKDLTVANTLSLGWQMGFLREYGGGAMDLGQFATKEGGVLQKVKSGLLDRPMFVSFYTAQALAYGGLMTWALSKQAPENLMDYVYPKNGEEDPEGKPQRVTTMFYPREFAAIYKHMENEGVVGGLGQLAASKSSGVIGLTTEWATGVNSFGAEIRDPNASGFKKLQQTLAYTLSDLEPISIGAIREQAAGSAKTTAMNIAGFGPAPKYVTESETEAGIKQLYRKYYAPRQTPYEKARFSEEAKQLRRYWESGDSDKFGDLLDQMQEKFQLTGKELQKLQGRIQGQGDPLGDMFARLTWQQQKRLLDKMSEEDRAVYLRRANKDHLRYNYEAPESP